MGLCVALQQYPSGSLTFLTAGHAQLAAIGALVAFHASDTSLAGAQSSHLLTVITH